MEYFPPYAPELNPVECVWGYVNISVLVNTDNAPVEVNALPHDTRRYTKAIQMIAASWGPYHAIRLFFDLHRHSYYWHQ